MAKICCVCNEQIGALGGKRNYNDYIDERVPLPEGMSELVDEGKTGDAGGVSGGINSYYYFQKNESILFPSGRN